MWVRRCVPAVAATLALSSGAASVSVQAPDQARPQFSRDTVTLTIPQVDYEPAIYYRDGDPYPHLDLRRVDRQRIVQKDHAAVVLENRYVRLTLLPDVSR